MNNLLWSTGLSELPLHDEWTANTLDLVRNCPTFSTDLKNVELPALDWMPSQILADPDTRRVLGKKMVRHVHQDCY